VGLIEALASAQRSASQAGSSDTFRINQPVQLGDGPFSDLIGRVQRFDAQGRVQILLEIMGRVVPVRTSLANLNPAEPPAGRPRSPPPRRRSTLAANAPCVGSC
jgi:transcriptional antiterminator RfaH